MLSDVGVQCRDGPFTPAETDRINDAIRKYQDVSLQAFKLTYVLTPSRSAGT